MPLDGIYLHLLTDELKSKLIGAKVEKIHQTGKVEMIFSFRARSDAFKLLLSASGNCPRIHFTTKPIENPAKPPMLCMLFRKHLTGAYLTDMVQAGFDRILKLVFSAINEVGDKVKRTVVVEIMAQYSNIILLDENDVIIDSVKRVDKSKSSVREILPSLKYVLPPGQDKLDITKVSADEIIENIVLKDAPLKNAILSVLEGVSPAAAKEISFNAGDPEKNSRDLSFYEKLKLKESLESLENIIVDNKTYPNIISSKDGKLLDFSYMPFLSFGGSVKTVVYKSLSETLENFYFERERLERTKTKSEDLWKTVNNLIERYSRKISAQMAELKNCSGKDEKKLLAELINAYVYNLKKGDSIYRVPNYYNGGEFISAPVKPELTPAENAAKLYKEYKKMKTAEEMLARFIDEGERDLEYLKTVLDELKRADTDKEIAEIRRELTDGGFIKKKSVSKEKKTAPLPPLEFTSPGGFKVLVGRNNISNDKLSLKTAKKDDIWFHIKDAPGSHVILSSGGSDVSNEDIVFSAEKAKYYSGKRGDAPAEVDYTSVKNLKKPAGARPGFVIYHVYKSVRV